MSFIVINTQENFTKEATALLTENGWEVRYRYLVAMPEEQFCQEIRDVDAVIAGGERYTTRVFDAANKLKIVARYGVGYERVDLDAAAKHGVWVTNTPGANAAAVAEFALGLILCQLRGIHIMAQEIRNGHWHRVRGFELGLMTVGVVGTGAIGQHMIQMLSGFGSKILAYDVVQNKEFAAKYQVQYVPLDELMARSDLVTLHCALNEHTKGLINAQRLALMKKTAYLVNTARAPIVDKEALIAALKANTIAGAAIDVHDPEPCAPDDPLVMLPNVLSTPWIASGTDGAAANMSIMSAREVMRVLKGQKPQFALNKVVR